MSDVDMSARVFKGESILISCNNRSNIKNSSLIELWKEEFKIMEGKKSFSYSIKSVQLNDGGTYTCKYFKFPNQEIENFHIDVTDMQEVLNDQVGSIVVYNKKSYYKSDFKCSVDFPGSFTSKLFIPDYSNRGPLKVEVCSITHDGFKVAEKTVNFIQNKCDKSVFLREFIPLKGNTTIDIVPPDCMAKKDFSTRILCDGKADETQIHSIESLISSINENFHNGFHHCRFIVSDLHSHNDKLQIFFGIHEYPINILRVKQTNNTTLQIIWKVNIDLPQNSTTCYFQVRRNLKIISKVELDPKESSLFFKTKSNQLFNGEIICRSSKGSFMSNVVYFSLINNNETEIFPILFHLVKISFNNAIFSWYDSHRDFNKKLILKMTSCMIDEVISDEVCSHSIHTVDETTTLVRSFELKYLQPEKTYKVFMSYKPHQGKYTKISDYIIFKTKASPPVIPSMISVIEGHNFIRISWKTSEIKDHKDVHTIIHLTTKSKNYTLHVVDNTTKIEISKNNVPKILLMTMQTARFYEGEYILSHHHIIYELPKNRLFSKEMIFSFTFVIIVMMVFIAQMIYSCKVMIEENCEFYKKTTNYVILNTL